MVAGITLFLINIIVFKIKKRHDILNSKNLLFRNSLPLVSSQTPFLPGPNGGTAARLRELFERSVCGGPREGAP